ncbi:MAG: ABC1 kinase family protein [Alphaproteobacteria bacterium]|tara:strand:- start:4767 stop:6098 length:1332 start_codon:yes stop_codon:yes gene_type:complete
MEDVNKFSKRFKRYTDLGTSAGSLAVKFLGTKILGKDKSTNAENLGYVLGNLKGPIMKIAQLASTVPDLLPPEYSQELTKLQSNAPPMGWNFVKRRMNNELGAGWQAKFNSFERLPFAAASLGQVHRANFGEKKVVCKLQYPDMLSIVEADINQLKLIFSVYKKFDSTINTSEIEKEITSRVREELDYHLEQKHMSIFSEIFKKIHSVNVPKVIETVSTKRLLTMNFLNGDKLLNFTKHRAPDRKKLAINMFKAWYLPFYKYGIIHGDPHLGNYSADQNLNINLLDFGCIRFFKPSFVQGVIDLYNSIKENNEDLAVKAYESWGFENISKSLIEILNIWARFLYSPLLEDKTIKMQETNSSVYGAEAASKVHKELKKIGGVKPPREFVFMDRAAIGMGSVFLHLDAEVNWYREFHNLIAGFSQSEIELKQKNLMSIAKIRKDL